MGNTLSAATQWISAKSDIVGKLEYTPVNELILNRIAEFTLNFTRHRPEESRVVFRKPMTWISNEGLSKLVNIGYRLNDDNVAVSKEMTVQGHPLLSARKLKSGCRMKALDFFHLGMALSVAKDQMAEVRACVEANRDPLSVILGDRFSNVGGYDSTVSRFVDDIINSREDDDTDVFRQKKLTLRLMFLLKEFDDRLMKESVETISKEVKLSPWDVNQVVSLLSKISGDKPAISVLQSIRWMQPYTFVFNNGCRAPFWRQIHGDISYIEAVPYDGPTIYITAATNGYFVNKGPEKNDEHNFERSSSFYRDLTALLRDFSAVFDAVIGEQKIFELWEKAEETGEKIISTKDLGREIPKTSPVVQLTTGVSLPEQVSSGTKGLPPKDDIFLAVPKRKSKVQGRISKTAKGKAKSKTTFSADTKQEKVKLKLEKWLEESSSSDGEDGDGPPEKVHYDYKVAAVELSTDHWYIQKLIKYIRGGNHTATIITLCNLRDLNLHHETSAASIRDTGGLEVLINLVECNNTGCQIGSLKILNEIAFSRLIRMAIGELGGVQLLIRLLYHWNEEIVWLAAKLIGQVATTSSVRRIIRVQKGIRKLVALIDIPSSYMGFVRQKGLKISAELASHKIGKGNGYIESAIKERWEKKLHVAQCAARALAACANSKRSRMMMRTDGIIPLLTRLLGADDVELLISLVGIIKEFAKEPIYRASIYSEGMIPDIVRTLKSDNHKLQQNSAYAIFKCANDEVIRHQILRSGGVEPLVALLNLQTKPDTLLPVTGAVWQLSSSTENLQRFQDMNVVALLVPLLTGQLEQVIVHVVGALAELTKAEETCRNFHKLGGLDSLLLLQTTTKPQLLINVNNTIAQCAKDIECTALIVKKDGVRLLWSALKNPCPEAQASASWALCPCIRNAKDSAELVRSFVGGLELLVNLLKSSHTDVLAATCAAIATVAIDEENLAVLSDNGIVMDLSKLTCTNDETLQEHLSEAIAQCCNYANNREAFGKEDAVVPLVKYLKKCKNPGVHRTTAKALHELSKFPDNCITMHVNDCVPLLVELVSSADRVTQESAAKCLYNIRRLALANQIADDIIID